MNLKEKVSEYLSKGMITVNKHPKLDLFIANYTRKVQYERLWDGYIEHFRGIIYDKDYNIVALPFSKIFNLQELDNYTSLLTQEVVAMEKMDGSLGILYEDSSSDIGWSIATRGSFTSEQATKANELLVYYMRAGFVPKKNHTYLFEIIYPENKRVVDYDNQEYLYFLGVRCNDEGSPLYSSYEYTGEEVDMFPKPRVQVGRIQALPQNRNEEGYVFHIGRPESRSMVKLKNDEYVRLHKILSNINEKAIWEIVSNGGSEKEILALDIPDEFYEFVKETAKGLRRDYQQMKVDIKALVKFVKHTSVTVRHDSNFVTYDLQHISKIQALLFKALKEVIDTTDYPDIIKRLSLLTLRGEKKEVETLIWKHLKPKNIKTDEQKTQSTYFTGFASLREEYVCS